MTNTDRVRDFLRGIAPADATNHEISARAGVRPHQQVFMITRSLQERGEIKGVQTGHEWRFSWIEGAGARVSSRLPTTTKVVAASAANNTHLWDSPDASEGRLGMVWKPVGRVSLSESRLEFPKVPAVPGLYRFRIRSSGNEARYIGESENLSRRFGFYRNPGPSQQTNQRLNGVFRTALAAGAEIAVAVIIDSAWMEVSGARSPPNFQKKSTRCLFENWAIVEGDGEPIESLNR